MAAVFLSMASMPYSHVEARHEGFVFAVNNSVSYVGQVTPLSKAHPPTEIEMLSYIHTYEL